MQFQSTAAARRFGWFAWAVLVFNLPVILWGAYVRVSFSGDGCGAHWPFCNGQALPRSMTKPTAIEFTHRMMTSVDSVLVIGLVALAFYLYPKRHLIRRYAVASLILLLIEALLGAGLVVFRMVARDQSAGRIWYLAAHLTNTMLLLAAIAITAWLASEGISERISIRSARPSLLWSAVVTILVSITGAVTALGDTLFPAASLISGVQQDLSNNSPILLRLRVAHPAVAVVGAMFVIWAAMSFWRSTERQSSRRAAIRVIALCCVQILAGAINLSLLAPLWMQLTHLLIADIVWIAMVLAVAESAHEEYARSLMSDLGSQTAARQTA